MNITVLSVGVRMPDWVSEAIGEYSKQFGREVNYALREIKPERRDSEVSARQGTAAEEKRILEAVSQEAYLVVLDERGKAPASLKLAGYLKVWTRNGDYVYFIIDGTNGMTEELKQQAKLILRLSSLTLPHSIIRILLAEQLYRAVPILDNRPYHREQTVFVRTIFSNEEYCSRQMSQNVDDVQQRF